MVHQLVPYIGWFIMKLIVQSRRDLTCGTVGLATQPIVKVYDLVNQITGFRKIDPDRWEFANEEFIRGQRHLLKNIKRRRTPPQPIPLQQGIVEPCVEVGRFGVDAEVDRLERDKQVLMMELVKLRQQQQNTRAYLQAMEQRLLGAEMKQQQMMNFLARAMQNPTFLQQLTQQKEKRKELEEALSKKRRRPIEQGPKPGSSYGSRGLGLSFGPMKAEQQEFVGWFGGSEVSELEALAMEMQGLGRAGRVPEYQEEEPGELTGDNKELDDEFWEELMNEGYKRLR
ncbi:hypothetical protein Droror1_Dr00003841 [Drosera rotundifolia]